MLGGNGNKHSGKKPISLQNVRAIEMQNFTLIYMKGGHTYIQMIFWELEFLGCIDNHIFSPMVLCCAHERALHYDHKLTLKYLYSADINRGYFACAGMGVACKNSCLSSLLVPGDVLSGGMSAPLQQKFHTDDVNQCLHNKMWICLILGFSWSIFIKFCVLLQMLKCFL